MPPRSGRSMSSKARCHSRQLAVRLAGHEVVVVALPEPRVPRPILAPLEAGHAVRDGRLLEGEAVHTGNVAEVEQAEASRADEAGRRIAEPELVALLGHRLALGRDPEAVQLAVGQARLLDRMAVALLAPDVDVDLAREVGRHRGGAERAVIGQHHDRLVLGVGTGDRVLVGEAAEARQLPHLPEVLAGHHARPAPPLADLLAVHVNPLEGALAIVVEGAPSRQIGRAVPLPHRGAGHVALGGHVPELHVLRVPGEVLALDDLEGPPVDRPPRDERALGAVAPGDAAGGGELVIHHERELVRPTRIHAQSVGDTDHPVAPDRVADGQDRHQLHAGHARYQVGLGLGARADVAGEGRAGPQERRAHRQHRGARQGPLQKGPSSQALRGTVLHSEPPW